MVAWEIKAMGGTIPRTDDRLIGDNMAVASVNCDLASGKLIGLPQAKFIIDLSGKLPVVKKAYRIPGDSTDPTEAWLPLPSPYSSVVRSPLANDDQHRFYWTNPGDPAPWFSTHEDIAAGNPPWNLGIIQPTGTPNIDSVTGGTPPPDALPISRSYLYTFINSFGEESAPSPASATVDGPPDATWTVSGFPTHAPSNPAGLNYPPIVEYRIYRTITSATSGAQFYRVADVTWPASGTYVDSVSDDVVVNNETLQSTLWENPPTGLDGLHAMPGGFLVGFTQNTVHFSEPDRPHTWPSVYDQSVHYLIVEMAVWQQYLMVLTTGYPSMGTGNMPSNFIFTGTEVAEPCIARGSVLVDLIGVYYATQNGLNQFTGYGLQNITFQIITKNQWLNKYRAANLIACRHRTQYMAINGSDQGFLIDYGEARLGVEDLSTVKGVDSVWNDEYNGSTMMCAGGKVYEWDPPDTRLQTYRWRSKRFFTPMPLSLGAVQVELDPEVLTPPSGGAIPLSNGDPTLVLPAGINAVFNYYAGPKLQLIMSRNLTKQMEIFRLPKGFKAFDHQAEIVASVPVSSIQLAQTLEELKRV